MKNIKYISLLLLAASFSACDISYFEDIDNELEEIAEVEVILPATDPGTADFSTFVSVGNSLTSGYTDGTVFIASQVNSFPNIMANKMANFGGGSFNQALVNDNIGGLLLGGNQIAGPRLFFNGAGPSQVSGTPTTEVSDIQSGPFNNLGVPGAKSYHLIAPGYGSVANVPLGLANPYFARMASAPNATVLEDAMAQNPSFFTLWIGNNDVLGYATTGGDGTNPITDMPTFNFAINTILDGLTANGAKGVIANIPDVTAIPFFTTVPHNPVPLDEATATLLNGGYAPYNGGLQAAFAALTGSGLFSEEELQKRTISFSAGQNAVVIIDEDLTDLGAINPAFAALPKFRQATADDLLILPSSSFIGTTVGGNPLQINGVSVPLADNWVLTPEEQEDIALATAAYNVTIANLASEKNIAFFDASSFIDQLSTVGVPFDDFTMSSSYVFGGAISLDGVHPTSRGYALTAKLMLQKIDEFYGSNFEASGNLPQADNYPTNYPPGI